MTMRFLACALALALLLPGCMEFTARASRTYPLDPQHVESETTADFFWGALEHPIDVNEGQSPRCPEGLSSVTATTNLLFILVSAATLGAVVPMTLRYTCAKPSP